MGTAWVKKGCPWNRIFLSPARSPEETVAQAVHRGSHLHMFVHLCAWGGAGVAQKNLSAQLSSTIRIQRAPK